MNSKCIVQFGINSLVLTANLVINTVNKYNVRLKSSYQVD